MTTLIFYKEVNMIINFYHTDNPQNTVGKTLTQLTNKDITLKADTDLINPSLLFKNDNFNKEVNYMKMLDRYYFVELKFIRSNTLVILNCNLDVLETYKDLILDSQADIIEKSSVSNVKQNDITQETITKVFKSDTIVPDGSSIIMQTTGEPLDSK